MLVDSAAVLQLCSLSLYLYTGEVGLCCGLLVGRVDLVVSVGFCLVPVLFSYLCVLRMLCSDVTPMSALAPCMWLQPPLMR